MKKNYMIISIDVEEAFDEIPYLLLREITFFFPKGKWQFTFTKVNGSSAEKGQSFQNCLSMCPK